MLTNVRLLRALRVGVAIGAVAAAAMTMSNRSGGATPRTPVAATTQAAGRTTRLSAKTNVGGDTHGNPSGNATFNGNDHGTGDPPTPGLNALFRAITVKARRVSAVVPAPAGLAVTNTTEISVLFGNRRVSQNYERKAGTTIAFRAATGHRATDAANPRSRSWRAPGAEPIARRVSVARATVALHAIGRAAT